MGWIVLTVISVPSVAVGFVAALIIGMGTHPETGGASTWHETGFVWGFGLVVAAICFMALSLIAMVGRFVWSLL